MQAPVGANVCRLRNVAWATGGHREGNPLSIDVVIQPLSRFKGRDGNKKKDTHLKGWSIYSMCVTMVILFGWSVCSTGYEWLQSGDTEKRKGRLLGFESELADLHFRAGTPKT